ITMLANDDAVRSVVWGDGGNGTILKGLPRGSTHVSMSTISVALSRELAEAHDAAGQGYVSAPVFGRPEAATAAKLWIVAAGKEEEIARTRPIFDAAGQGTFTVGFEASRANVVKIGGNFLIASMLEALGESFAMMRKSGVDVKQFLSIVNSLFRSPVFAN